jgi:glutaminase
VAPAVLDPEHLEGVHARPGIPRNPFINVGALVVTDRLLTLTGDACGTVERFLRTECACPEIASDQVAS